MMLITKTFTQLLLLVRFTSAMSVFSLTLTLITFSSSSLVCSLILSFNWIILFFFGLMIIMEHWLILMV